MSTSVKLTDKKIYTAIVEGTFDDLDTDEIVAWAGRKIASLNRKSERAKAAAAEKKAAGDELTEAVYDALTDDFQTIADVAAQIEGADVTVAKISYRLNALAKDGRAEKGEITVDGEGKKRKLVGYKLIG